MKPAATTILALILSAAAGGSAFAAQPADTQVRLKLQEQELAAAARQQKGGARQQLEQEQRRVQGLIDDLENGRPVPPSQLDRTLKRNGDPLR